MMAPGKGYDGYYTIQKKTFESALTHLLRSEFGFLGGPAVIKLMADRIKTLCDQYYPPISHLRLGQMLWLAVSVDETRSQRKTLENLKMVPVILSIVTPEDLKMYVDGAPLYEIRKKVVARMLKEAYNQKGTLPLHDLAAILKVTRKNISKAFMKYQKETGEILPSRGVLHHIGGTVTHKAMIVAEYFEGKQSPEIAKKFDHTVEASDRYIKHANQVKDARDWGISDEKIPFVTGLSSRLVKEYLALLGDIEKKSIKGENNND